MTTNSISVALDSVDDYTSVVNAVKSAAATKLRTAMSLGLADTLILVSVAYGALTLDCYVSPSAPDSLPSGSLWLCTDPTSALSDTLAVSSAGLGWVPLTSLVDVFNVPVVLTFLSSFEPAALLSGGAAPFVSFEALQEAFPAASHPNRVSAVGSNWSTAVRCQVEQGYWRAFVTYDPVSQTITNPGAIAAIQAVPGFGSGSGGLTAPVSKASLSTAVQTSLDKADTAVQTSSKGIANGIASLGSDGLIPAAQIPYFLIIPFVAGVSDTGRVFHPEDWGAKGDFDRFAYTGTDDTAALQQAFSDTVKYSLRLDLRNKKYLATAPIVIGSNTDMRTDAPTVPVQRNTFSIEGWSSGGGVGDLGASITFVGVMTDALIVGDNAMRSGSVGGFSVFCKPTLNTHIYWVPENETEFPVTNGISFKNSYHTHLRFYRMNISNTRRTIAHLAGTYVGNGEFTEYDRVMGWSCQRFYYQAPNTGESYNPTFRNCYALAYWRHVGTEFVAFETGGGGGYGLTCEDFNSTIVHSFSEFPGTVTSVENVARATLIKNNGQTGVLRFSGGRNEGYTTLYHNNGGYAQGITIAENIDMAGMMSSERNPTVLSDVNDVKGAFIARSCILPVMSRTEANATGAKLRIKLNKWDWGSYVFDQCSFNARNDATGAVGDLEVSYASQPTSQVKFIDCLYRDSPSQNDLTVLSSTHRPAGYTNTSGLSITATP